MHRLGSIFLQTVNLIFNGAYIGILIIRLTPVMLYHGSYIFSFFQNSLYTLKAILTCTLFLKNYLMMKLNKNWNMTYGIWRSGI